MFEKMAQRFMDECYLAGWGTHERIVEEMARDLRLRFWLGLSAGSILTLAISVIISKLCGGF